MERLVVTGQTVSALAHGGHLVWRLLAVADSRSVVRTLFLSSLVRSRFLSALAAPAGAPLDELAALGQVGRPERLSAWLAVGCALGELRLEDGRYRVHGRRTRALVVDPLLASHYRSLLDYQAGPYGDLAGLLSAAPGEGRDDLERFAQEIAEVSLAALPFVAPRLRRVVGECRPRKVLDAGCGSAAYSKVVLDADPRLKVTGVDLAPSVISTARSDLGAAGHAARVTLQAADLLEWSVGQEPGFDLVMLHNNIYYFEEARRPRLFRTMRDLLAPGGEVLVTTMTRTGSVAAAHLQFMLRAQNGSASLPSRQDLLDDLSEASLRVVSLETPVPTEPYVMIRAVADASDPRRRGPLRGTSPS